MYKENYLKILNLIIGVINNNEKKEEKLYKSIVEDLDNYFLQNNIFFIEIKENNFCIPLYILQNLKKDNDFDIFMVNKISNYVIDENAILEGKKNIKYLLLIELYNKPYFNYKYKEKTLSALSTIIQNRDKYPYKKFKKIYENINDFKEILLENERKDLVYFYINKMVNYEHDLKSLENISLLLNKLYPSKELINIQKIKDLIYKFEESKIVKLDSFKDEINIFQNEYRDKINKYYIYLNSYLFLKLIKSEENQNKNDEDEKVEKVKIKIDHFIQIIFNPINNEEKISQILEKEDFNILENIKNEQKLKEELESLYDIYWKNIINKLDIRMKNEKDKRINFIVGRIKILKEFKSKSKIIKGMYSLLLSLKFKSSDYFKELENIYLNINKIKKDEFLMKVNYFFANNKLTNIEDKNSDLFIFLSEHPNGLKFLLRMTDDEMESLYQFIIDSDYNEQIYLFSLNRMKIYFKNLYNKYDYEIIEKINNNFIKNIDNYIKAYPYLKKLNEKKIGKMKSYNEILQELDDSIFYIKYNYLKQKYELTNIISNDK